MKEKEVSGPRKTISYNVEMENDSIVGYTSPILYAHYCYYCNKPAAMILLSVASMTN